MIMRKIFAVLIAGFIALSTSVGLAQAQSSNQVGTVITGNVEKLDFRSISDIDPIKLTIQKPAPHPYNDVDPGQLPEDLVSGFTFTLHRVNEIDIKSREGCDRIADLNRADARAVLDGRIEGLSTTEVASATTDRTGKVDFEVDRGLYIVTEEKPEGAGENYRNAQPFFIVLPAANEDGTAWSYDLHITAKTEPSEKPTQPETTPPMPPEEVPPMDPTPPSEDPGQRGSFADTGANVMSLILLGLLLIAFGAYTLFRNRQARS